MNHAAPPPRWAVVTWALLLAALGLLLTFAAWYGEQKREREVRTLLFANTSLQSDPLADCLEKRLPLTMDRWTRIDSKPSRIINWNIARGLRVTIIDGGPVGRRLEIATPGRRPLRDQEAQALRQCLAGG